MISRISYDGGPDLISVSHSLDASDLINSIRISISIYVQYAHLTQSRYEFLGQELLQTLILPSQQEP